MATICDTIATIRNCLPPFGKLWDLSMNRWTPNPMKRGADLPQHSVFFPCYPPLQLDVDNTEIYCYVERRSTRSPVLVKNKQKLGDTSHSQMLTCSAKTAASETTDPQGVFQKFRATSKTACRRVCDLLRTLTKPPNWLRL